MATQTPALESADPVTRELLDQARDYEQFADEVGAALAPAYRALARSLRASALRLAGPQTAGGAL